SIAIPELHKYRSTLDALTRKNAQFHWTQNLERCFRHIIQLIMHHTLLHIYNPKYKLVLSTDASEHSMGGCLQQINPVTRQRETIAHFAKTLTPTQQRYSMTEKEGLAFLTGCKKFRYYLFGKPFVGEVDHKAQLFIFNHSREISKTTSARLQRWAYELTQYQFELMYCNTKEFAHADTLSRLIQRTKAEYDNDEELVIAETLTNFSKEQIAEETVNDPVFKEALVSIQQNFKSLSISKELQWFRRNRKHLTILDNELILYKKRVMLPRRLQEKFLEVIHHGHPSFNSMYNQAKNEVYFPAMQFELRRLYDNCDFCQQARKKARRVYGTWNASKARQYIHGDIVYLSDSNNSKYLLLVDAFSAFPFMYKLRDISSESVKKAIHQFELDFGKPDTYIFDQGTQFQGLHDINNKILVPANSQHANGVCERQVQRLKKCLLRNHDVKTDLAISLYLSQARFEKTFGASAAEKFFGLELSRVLPFTVETSKMKMLSRFQPNDMVYAFFKTGVRWRRAKIIKCMGSKVFQLQLVDGNENGKLFSRHINELRR
uniref:RNA-directed DNA polymerase n=1 Tax=Strongyloides papillosus TaxID=174720 RepID=A0A0N5BDU6_STREA